MYSLLVFIKIVSSFIKHIVVVKDADWKLLWDNNNQSNQKNLNKTNQ